MVSGVGCPVVSITPADKYPTVVIPAKAEIQEAAGCWIKSGMTELVIQSPG
jgi:hypothetical protein